MNGNQGLYSWDIWSLLPNEWRTVTDPVINLAPSFSLHIKYPPLRTKLISLWQCLDQSHVLTTLTHRFTFEKRKHKVIINSGKTTFTKTNILLPRRKEERNITTLLWILFRIKLAQKFGRCALISLKPQKWPVVSNKWNTQYISYEKNI
jgi:hypothetical protein